ncbi:MAG: bifunctional phosphoribosylaminoimidazolecarboxamide formyltransferase/IMP cyclohydrolase [Candidatus Aenigmatarchaeota archaeon]|nr:MAG: bifunctional phosphoribosylaminoimidazolecarboxamide formyltransferase/IMP cyclohydrolase [Candidatus Aenigmarchaeota archaeon]
MKIKRALISVTDKKGVVEFAKSLASLGVEIISTGGTAKLLKDTGVKVTYVGDHTGFPEIMDGRVRTLHPKIHGGILGVRENKEHRKQMGDHGISQIDMVVVNLYQFEKTVEDPKVKLEDAIENIDIGGPALIRSAAKNYRDVVVVTDPEEYNTVISQLKSKGDIDFETRKSFALQAFRRTADYDSEIDKFLSKRFADEDVLRLKFSGGRALRYGENWHQKARVFKKIAKGLVNAKHVQGKGMSYNNYVDSESALEAANDLKGIGVAVVKHTNPCGYSTGGNLREALEHAWKGDPVSAFGSVIAFTKPVDKEAADFLKDKFVEVLIAPGFEKGAKQVLEGKKNMRLLEIRDPGLEKRQYRFLSGGLLEQDRDEGYAEKKDFEIVTKTKFPADKKDLAMFACLACKHTKSNAVVVVREYKPGFYHVIGMGAGQPNRVGSLKIAIGKAKENIKNLKLGGNEISKCVLASDSFFPFPDSVEEANKHGIRFIIQPGGSVRDKEIIATCDKFGIAMIFTGRRMFKH